MLALSEQYPTKRAFVTGAASGFGLALSTRLAQDDWTVGLADIDVEGLDAAAATIRDHGGTPHTYRLDVSDAAAFQQVAEQFIADAGGADVVINNAGIGVGGAFEETPLADWNAVVQINLMGVVHGCYAFLPHLKAAGGGHLINVASAAAFAAGPYMAAYNTAKAGVLALSETLYSEVHDAGIGVSVVMPTFFQTNIGAAARGGPGAQVMTQKLIDDSDVTADEVAAYALEQAGEGTLHVLYPTQAKLAWHWKRLLPGHYLKSMIPRARKTARFLDRLPKEDGSG
jgi:NAD(P)-dependent dehydrogenase (short-subunit alcohol dehydrogenase family)